jgi:hypothetical protein
LSSVPIGSGGEEVSERAKAEPGPGEGVIPGRTIRFYDEQQQAAVAAGRTVGRNDDED